ncbi:MAG: ribosomal protein S18-alanine N-acetyltransferase [Mariprofundus sp.]|nr:ribosomal protein S18-alanine N-acetyltransferase [Mariprofundus sp.]
MDADNNISFRPGSIADVEAIYRLNQDVFSEHWSRASLYSSLESGYDVLLCELNGDIIAYLLSLSVLDEIQIMQIAVSEQHRRQGLASRMTDELIASATDMQSITLEVRASNQAARACYTQLGFQETGYRKHYYAPDASGCREDAVLMTKHLQGVNSS